LAVRVRLVRFGLLEYRLDNFLGKKGRNLGSDGRVDVHFWGVEYLFPGVPAPLGENLVQVARVHPIFLGQLRHLLPCQVSPGHVLDDGLLGWIYFPVSLATAPNEDATVGQPAARWLTAFGTVNAILDRLLQLLECEEFTDLGIHAKN